MAQVTFKLQARVIAGICGKFGYQEVVKEEQVEMVINEETGEEYPHSSLVDVPNPENKVQFTKRMLRTHAIRKWVVEHEEREQRKAIRTSIQEDFDTNFSID